MKNIFLFIAAIFFVIPLFAQQKEFQGTITYSVVVKSKVKGFDDNYFKKVMGTGDRLTVDIKDGNYRHTTGFTQIYYIQKDKKVYYKFRNLDTLYYLDYNSDTTGIASVVKSDSSFRVNQFACKSVTITTTNSTSRFLYSTTLHGNPAYDADNTIGRFDVYTKATDGAVWLSQTSAYAFATQTVNCVQVAEKKLDDHIFELPKLPVKKFKIDQVSTAAHFPGKPNAWSAYLTKNIDASLAIKYLKPVKGVDSISQTVIVAFTITEEGLITAIDVENKDQVHPKLAQEAMRVVRDSPNWIPAKLYGEKIMARNKQPIVFKTK